MNASLRPRGWLLALSALIVLAGIGWSLKDGPLAMTHAVGYAVCHQMRVRTYVFGERVLPLCARCSGQYLGAMTGFLLAFWRGRLRASGLPSRGLVIVLVAFLAIWGLDGINSYVFLATQQPFLYMPHNALRLATGLLQGIAVSSFFIIFFNQVFWRQPDPRPLLTGWQDLGLLLLVATGLGLAVHSRWQPLFYPLALISAGGVFVMLSLVGLLTVVLLLKAENSGESWWDFVRVFIPGMALALLLIAGIDALRAWGEQVAGMQ